MQYQLNGVRAAAKALGSKASREVPQVKEASNVRCCESEDFKSNKIAVG